LGVPALAGEVRDDSARAERMDALPAEAGTPNRVAKPLPADFQPIVLDYANVLPMGNRRNSRLLNSVAHGQSKAQPPSETGRMPVLL
jgi:hypothetical protein